MKLGKVAVGHSKDVGRVTSAVPGVALAYVRVEVPARCLLDQVSLTIFPTELVALMGPSGAGKTTLMNALNGYTPPSAGDPCCNPSNARFLMIKSSWPRLSWSSAAIRFRSASCDSKSRREN